MLYFFMVAHKASCRTLEGFLEVYLDMVEILLVLDILFKKGSEVEDLLCSTSTRSEACLFFSDDLLRLWLQSVQCDLQHDVA